MSVGHLDHILIVYNSMEHVTWKSPGPIWYVAELVGSCIPIHAHRCLPDPKCLFDPCGLLLCLSVDHFCLVPVDDMVLFHGMVCDFWLVDTLCSLVCQEEENTEREMTCETSAVNWLWNIVANNGWSYLLFFSVEIHNQPSLGIQASICWTSRPALKYGVVKESNFFLCFLILRPKL